MAKDSSFDVVSEFDKQELVNAVDQVKRDISSRFDLKDSKLKVQASIQGEQVRVSGKSKDDLQEVIQLLRKNEDKYDYPLQFTNYR